MVNKEDNIKLLNLPVRNLKTIKSDSKTLVFDVLRKKYVVLTPEELVRQLFVHWLIEDLEYPASMINNEITLKLNGLSRRCDSLVFDKNCNPWMIIEYKAPTIRINQDTFNQIVRYNMVLHAKYLVVSNGITHYCCKMDYVSDSYEFIPNIPSYLS